MLQLINEVRKEGDPDKNWVPTLNYELSLDGTTSFGKITLRLGNSDFLTRYAGQIGYEVNSGQRNRGYASQACQLIKPIAKKEGFSSLWITCNPDNIPSKRVCEKIGAEFVEKVDIPEDTDMYKRGERQKLRFCWKLS